MDKARKFRFKLASHLGMTVKELEERMTFNEFLEWQEYAKDEPLIADRLEMMLAQVVSSQSGIPSYQAMVSINNDDKETIKQQQMAKDLKEQLR